MTPIRESEHIQDFLDAFDGIMGIQNIDRSEWLLRLTPLINGKARGVCTGQGSIMDYNGVKKEILSHYNVSPERSQKQFHAHVWTKDAEPNEWTAKGINLMKR